ncbi:MAG: selenocysteine-specific translation elongation factor [Anaerolineaceae bacterium]|nr:MAG: selenocysteine-specific translation elongation factor [Anaerolineaceae bacterium]
MPAMQSDGMRVIGTAGHVDHGKSALVQRLTGIDPDRLREEKKRGLTIDLGFAWFDMDGATVGIVDVPGHRDFIENMLAGVGGIDLALLVVAVDEGIMPQTREHVAILDILNVNNAVVALTKCDLIDDGEWREMVALDVAELLDGTTMQGAAIVPVSAHSGEGVAELMTAIRDGLQHPADRQPSGYPILPIDRVFSIAGFGTVVTGTLTGGTLRTGDEIEIQPGDLRGRVRGLQSYKQTVQTAHNGARVAVNITGIDRERIERGSVLSLPGLSRVTTRADVFYSHLPEATHPLKHNARVKLFCHTAQAVARCRLLDAEEIRAGESAWVQLVLDTPLVVRAGERFIVRSPSPPATIGGGTFIQTAPRRRHKRFRPPVIEALESLRQGTPAQRIAQAAHTTTPQKSSALLRAADSNDPSAIQQALDDGLLIEILPGQYMATGAARGLMDRILDQLSAYHQANPLQTGIPREELRSKLGIKLNLLDALSERIPVCIEKDRIRLESHQITFSASQQAQIARLMAALHATPYTPPSFKEAVEIVGADVLYGLIALGEIVQIADDVILAPTAYAEMSAGVSRMIAGSGSVDAKAVRDAFATSRKYAIALLEHLDEIGQTRRVGDVRVAGRNADA